MPLPLGAISLAMNINQKLVNIYPKSKGTILNLFIKTGNDYSLAVNSMHLLTSVFVVYVVMLQVKVNIHNHNFYEVIYIT